MAELNEGSSSIESWDDEPACTFDPETGFAINQRSLHTLRWYTYLNAYEDGDGLESTHDQ